MSSGFFDRLVARIDKLGPESLQAQMMRLARERGFLETIFQTIQEGIMVLDSEGKLLYANRAAEKLAGFEFSRTKGRSVLRLLREWDWEHLFDVPEGNSQWNRMVTREVEITYPEHRFVSVYAVPLDEEGVSEKGVLVIFRDVTRDRLQEASTLENERSNAVKLLAAGVAHEIGNPLNALNIHLQLLARELSRVPEETRKPLEDLVEVARAEVGRLDAIITQFLRALRPSKPVLQTECPKEVLQETLRVLKSEFENRRIQVAVDVPDHLPAMRLDRAQIKQVFFNLIKNALEAMSDGGTLKVVFTVGDVFVDIAFIDSGKGLLPDEFGRVFDPYYTTKAKGNGLGLMIVKRIIEEHGGEIELSSKPGEGTCFKIRLPRSERRIRLLGTPTKEETHEKDR
ncbi:MAG TPA: ATP-binding protein [Kiritimatiellia bacterium]|jgi:PAS domain S-box-containing protein|nr:ATP-binding protein [Candidatus Latescibacterota bacterium]HOM59126.1 ATP-binding protein [Kiritimatiellia bacterium]HOR97933.1 ATP-binding protein [Kiritimatiellia bacterium]HPK37729.1 ATP-binding protein [Kiritimatiellia bacterium]